LTSDVTHQFTADAVVNTTLRLIKRQSLDATATTDRVLARDLLSMTTRSLRHAEDHMLLLGQKDAVEKVAAFLLEMDKRLTDSDVVSSP
jgi:CRP/FNR family transcriptional regulator, nitrogen fixation regulation protein